VESRARIIDSMLEIPYKLGSWNPEEGLDCFTFLVEYGRRCGIIELGDAEYRIKYAASKGLDLSKYPYYFKHKTSFAMEVFRSFVQDYTEEVGLKNIECGDIIVAGYSGPDFDFYFLIYGGNSVCFGMFEEGVTAINMSMVDVREVRRWVVP